MPERCREAIECHSAEFHGSPARHSWSNGLHSPSWPLLHAVGPLLWAPTASDIESPTDLDWVSLCFETEISRCALDSCMAQQRSNCLQIASTFQNVESLRPARRLYAVIRGIESRLDDPELQQAFQLPLTHRMTALNVSARK